MIDIQGSNGGRALPYNASYNNFVRVVFWITTLNNTLCQMFRWGSAGLSAKTYTSGSQSDRSSATQPNTSTHIGVSCFDRGVSLDGTHCQHVKIWGLDPRIWRGSIEKPHMKVDGYPSWNEVVSDYTRPDSPARLQSLNTTNEAGGRDVFCACPQHFIGINTHKYAATDVPLRIVPTLLNKPGGANFFVSSP